MATMSVAPMQGGNVMIATLQKYGYDLREYESDTLETSELIVSPTGTPSTASLLTLREPKNYQTAIHIAVKKGHMEVLQALAKLPQFSDFVNATDKYANTALHFAASSSKPCAKEMTQLLLDHGATPTAVNNQHLTPLATHLLTTKTDTVDIAQCFLKQSIELNELVDGGTYLHMAMSRQLMELACILISNGASINVPNSSGSMVCDKLTRKTFVKLCCFMKDGTQVTPPNVPQKACKLCRQSAGLLESLTNCKHCGRCCCKPCSKKVGEIRKAMNPNSTDKEVGRYCQTCATVLQLRDMKDKSRAGFNEKMFGFSPY